MSSPLQGDRDYSHLLKKGEVAHVTLEYTGNDVFGVILTNTGHVSALLIDRPINLFTYESRRQDIESPLRYEQFLKSAHAREVPLEVLTQAFPRYTTMIEDEVVLPRALARAEKRAGEINHQVRPSGGDLKTGSIIVQSTPAAGLELGGA